MDDKVEENNNSTEPVLKLKQVFVSDDELEESLATYEAYHKQKFVIDKSYTYEELNLKKIKNPVIKYHTLRKQCKYGPERKSEATGKRDGRTFKRNCESFIKFEGHKGKFYVLVDLNLEHKNHEGYEALYENLPDVRRLTDKEKEEARFLHSLNSKTSLLHQHMMEKTKKQILPQDLYNTFNQNKDKNGNDIEAAIQLLKTKYEAKVEILEENSEFQGLYFSTPEMRQNMSKYPEVVCVDSTYKVFNLRFSLMLFVIEDGDGRSHIVGIGILVSESRPIVKWLMECFKEDNLEAVKKTCGFISDKDLTERSVIREVFDWARLFICQFHTLKIFGREICPTKMQITKEQKEKALQYINIMVKSSCQMDYDNAHSKFMSTAPDVIKNYFIKNWQDITDEWVKFKIFDLNLKNLTNNRIESLNGKLKNEIGTYNSLVDFIKKYFKWTNYRLKCMSLKDIQRVLKISPNDVSKTDFGKAKASYKKCLTHFAYKAVLEEFEYFEFMTLLNFEAVSQTCTATCRKEEIYITPYTCTCFEMTSMGLPCRHILAIRLALKMPLFSKDICLERWLKSSASRIDDTMFDNTSFSESSQASPRPNESFRQSPRPSTVVPVVPSVRKIQTKVSSSSSIENSNKKDASSVINKKSLTTKTLIKKVNTPSRLTIGEKRRRIKVTIDELMEVITEQSDAVYHSRSTILKNLLDHWKNNKDINIVATDKSSIDCIQSDSNLEETLKELSLEESNLAVANIKMPTPRKRRGQLRGIKSCTIKPKKN